MSYLLYLLGFVIGVAIFIYLLTLYESGKEKVRGLQKSAASAEKAEPDAVDPRMVFGKRGLRAPGERVCPLCGSLLTQMEGLYATPLKTAEGPKILIMGCRYCYKTGE
ncbi:MAG: hypothetical protein EPN93_07570 [Spirochaetes bacterium]|nr:MAG: hypothetical protein EPN93_07570 [Spirochaetota bacterium]